MAVKELRKGSKADSQTAEDKFNSLNRFALNLNDIWNEYSAGDLSKYHSNENNVEVISLLIGRHYLRN